jgi:hypothetical protein
VLYHFSYAPPTLFALLIFQVRLMPVSWVTLKCYPPTYNSKVTEIIVMNHHAWLALFETGSQQLFFLVPRLALNHKWPISTSQVAGMIGISHYAWPSQANTS